MVSVGQLESKLQAVKVGGLKKVLPRSLSQGGLGSTREQWDHPPTLTACNFAANLPIETHSTSLERTQPP